MSEKIRPLLSFLDQKSDLTNEIQSLESFFSITQLPDPPFCLNQCSVIVDIPKFISSHLSVLGTYNGNPVFLPYLHRLQLLQQIIQSKFTTE